MSEKDPSPGARSEKSPSGPGGARPGRPGQPRDPAPPGTGRGKGNPVAWTALLVAAVLTVWQAVYSVTVLGVTAPDRETFTSVSLFVTLVLGLAATVLGIVGIAQRRAPRWPGLVGLSVGLYAFVVAVFSWIGGLMNTGA